MSDECRYCECRGHINRCLSTECNQHDSWYAIRQRKLITELEGRVLELKADIQGLIDTPFE